MDHYDPATRTGEQLDLPGILEEAKGLVHGERQSDYGHPADDFGRVARLLSAAGFRRLHVVHTADLHEFKHRELEQTDIPIIQICVKLSRLTQTPDHRDSMVDIAGYAETWGLCEEDK